MTTSRTSTQIRNEQLAQDPEFRAHWERTVLARAVANALVGFRVERGITQTEAGRRLGMRQSQVARMELGEHTPSLDTLRRLATLLGKQLILAITPPAPSRRLGDVPLPVGATVLEEVTSVDGTRLLVASA